MGRLLRATLTSRLPLTTRMTVRPSSRRSKLDQWQSRVQQVLLDETRNTHYFCKAHVKRQRSAHFDPFQVLL